MHPYFVLVDAELRILREKIVQNYNELSIRDLCAKRSGRYDVMFFKLDHKYCEMMSKITEIKCSLIFNKLWQKYGEILKDEVITMEIIFNKMWSRICEELKSTNQQFLDGEMRLQKIDEYSNMFKNYDALQEEFMLLSKHFSETTTSLVKGKLGVIIKKVKNYKELFDAQQAAQTILQLKKTVGLEGDFSEVEKIEKVRLYFLVCCWACIGGQA